MSIFDMGKNMSKHQDANRRVCFGVDPASPLPLAISMYLYSLGDDAQINPAITIIHPTQKHAQRAVNEIRNILEGKPKDKE